MAYYLTGGAGWDVLTATAQTVPYDFDGVDARGGSDTIVRDRTGNWEGVGGSYGTIRIWGDAVGISTDFDTVSYAGSLVAVSVDLDAQRAQSVGKAAGKFYGVDRLFGVEGVRGTSFDDALFGSAASEDLRGGLGADDVVGRGGRDTLRGGAGDDHMAGEAGDDRLYGEADDDDLFGGAGSDRLYGGTGADALQGDGGADDVFGGSGDDAVYVGDAEADDLDGGTGVDWLIYAGPGPVTANLFAGTVARAGVVDHVAGFENLRTGESADVVFGTSGSNEIHTRGGADTIYAVGGADRIKAGSGNDMLVGYAGAERLWGETGRDTLNGGGGDDLLWGGTGSDLIEGASGADTLYGGAGGSDTFRWRAGHAGQDLVSDFDLGVDRIAFGSGYFDGQAGPGFDVRDALVAFTLAGRVFLHADRAYGGWTTIAEFEDVTAAQLEQRIANGSIFDVVRGVVDIPDGLLG